MAESIAALTPSDWRPLSSTIAATASPSCLNLLDWHSELNACNLGPLLYLRKSLLGALKRFRRKSSKEPF
jgi:hypothetical protein